MRQFIASRAPDRGGNLVISDSKDYKYLCRVLRLSVSDSIAVRLPDGGLCAMTVSAIDAKTKTVVLSRQPDVQGVCVSCGAETGVQAMQVERDTAGSAVTYWLFQFLPKIQKMDTIIRQAVETGVAHIVPVLGAFSPPVRDGAAERAPRWQRLVREARQQSGSPVCTVVHEPLPPEQACALWKREADRGGSGVLLSERSGESCALSACIAAVPRAAAIAVGCEGGITDEERTLFCANGFRPVHFATNILRTETAALYGIAAVQSRIMEMENTHAS